MGTFSSHNNKAFAKKIPLEQNIFLSFVFVVLSSIFIIKIIKLMKAAQNRSLYNGFIIYLDSLAFLKKISIIIKKSPLFFYNEAVLFFNLIKADGEITPKIMQVPFIRIIEKNTQSTGRLRIAVKIRFPQTIFFIKALHPDMV